MWLKYGVASNGELVCVADVASGKTELLCPYCQFNSQFAIRNFFPH
jgi:hypothetical protein